MRWATPLLTLCFACAAARSAAPSTAAAPELVVLERGGDGDVDAMSLEACEVRVRGAEVVACASGELGPEASLDLSTSWMKAQARSAVLAALRVTVAEETSERDDGRAVVVTQRNAAIAKGVFEALPEPSVAWARVRDASGERLKLRAELRMPRAEVQRAVERAVIEAGAQLDEAAALLGHLEAP